MGNAAIATFLIQWLMGQREMRLKISDFSKTYFKQLIDSEQQKEENIEKIDTETRYKALLKACDDICIMQIMREIQADEEGSKIKRPPKDERKFSLPTLYAMGYTAWSKFKKNGKRENNFNIVLGLDLYLLTVLEYSTGGDFIDKQ